MSINTHLATLATKASRKIDLAYLQLEEAQVLIEQVAAELARSEEQSNNAIPRMVNPTGITIDRATFSVHWKDATSIIGPTVSFYFMEAISRRPNRFYTYEHLIEVVWGGKVVTDATIRGAARDLRRHLKANDMADLAAAIRGKMKMYGLITDALSS